MAKIRNPVRFSKHFGIDPQVLENLGVLDPSLNLDTRLFIDPLLLPVSSHPEINVDAVEAYNTYFSDVVTLLRVTKTQGDKPWEAARRLLSFPEVKWTCLGYGAGSVSGSGSGPDITENIIKSAKEIVDFGIEDPKLFVLLGLLEEGMGPDRISDMATNVTLQALIKFNERILPSLNIPTFPCSGRLKNGLTYQTNLPRNPFQKKGTPILLIPQDILRSLPIAIDEDDLDDLYWENQILRDRVNQQIGEIWQKKTLKDKEKMKSLVLQNKETVRSFLNLIDTVPKKAYDFKQDPKGELFWRQILETIAKTEPKNIEKPEKADFEGAVKVATQILEQFKFLIEKRRQYELLYSKGIARNERSAQHLFYAVASSYCKANNIDITPEAETGYGPVDFKLSQGYQGKVLVEVKLSTNPQFLHGYTRQLDKYQQAEEAHKCYYVFINVGGKNFQKKQQKLITLKHKLHQEGSMTKQLVFIDATPKESASKI